MHLTLENLVGIESTNYLYHCQLELKILKELFQY